MGGDLIREARKRAGLTQAELAGRAGTTQSSIARWESGRTQPGFDTVRRLALVCGLDATVGLIPADEHDRSLLNETMRLTPQQRYERLRAWRRSVDRAQVVR